jgi:L-threonylcarbamoyladenylate synthase
VYGLGADALDPAAVRRVFEAKGRPARNPLIVHVPSASAARALALEWTTLCETLAARFWPGPLTLVVRRSRSIPADVTAGGPTVALRVPAHPVALALLNAAQVPIAAPSANRSGLVSPTEAAHVLAGLRGRIDIVLDAGRTQAGIESTVLDVTGSVPVVLRPGPISSDELEAALGCVIGDRAQPGQEEVLRSPGLLSRH